jgi:uncharacterized membrane protein
MKKLIKGSLLLMWLLVSIAFGLLFAFAGNALAMLLVCAPIALYLIFGDTDDL